MERSVTRSFGPMGSIAFAAISLVSLGDWGETYFSRLGGIFIKIQVMGNRQWAMGFTYSLSPITYCLLLLYPHIYVFIILSHFFLPPQSIQSLRYRLPEQY